MSYHARYGLDFNPFIKNSKDTLIETTENKEVVYRLKYLLNTKGFGVITGASGRGKTTTVRHWANSLNPSLCKVIYIPLSTVTVIEFYRQLAESLGLEARYRKSENFRMIQAEITRLAIEKRITPVIIIDEANYISSGILNDLKMMFNFEKDSKDMAVILLVGLPQLNNTLRLASNEPLRQRIVMNYHLEHLSKEEGLEYIMDALKAACSRQPVFDEAALEAILNTAGGVIRLINKICDICLFIGNNKKAPTITTEIVMSAVNEIELD